MKSKQNFETSKKILIGITGCISAYKMCECIRQLIKKKYQVRVVLTPCARKFVTETTLSLLSQNQVHVDPFDSSQYWFPRHIELAAWSNLFLISPLSAHMLSQIIIAASHNLLLSTLLAYSGKVLLCPSMNDQMYKNEMVQSNLIALKKTKRYHILDPSDGFLACLSSGQGRLPDIKTICQEVDRLCA